MELRCSRRKHAETMGNVVEIHCRRCSTFASDETTPVRVFHRWRYIGHDDWIKLPDRETKQARTPHGRRTQEGI